MPKIALDKIEDLLVNALYREQRSTQEVSQGLRREADVLLGRAEEVEKQARDSFGAGLTALTEKRGLPPAEPGQVVYLRAQDGSATLEWPEPSPRKTLTPAALLAEREDAEAMLAETVAHLKSKGAAQKEPAHEAALQGSL